MEITAEPREHYFYISISGIYTDDEGVESLRHYARLCQKHNLNTILIDTRQLKGEISTMAEFGRGLEFATAFKDNTIHIAVVGGEQYAPRESLFETVARNREVPLQVFDNIDKAKEWLKTFAR